MIHSSGRKRVVVANVTPMIDGGAYRAKAVLDREFIIAADIFTDGHDEVSAGVLIRHAKERSSKELPMDFLNNDRWELSYYPIKTGVYKFQVQGWVDHFSTWRKGLLKKLEAGQDVCMDLEVGAAIIEEAAVRGRAQEKRLALDFSKQLRQAVTAEDGLQVAGDNRLADLMWHLKNPELVTVFPQILEFEVERERATFSTWYEIFPRSAAPEAGRHGSFRDVIRLLPKIAALGFDTLYFPPIHPIGEVKRKGRNNALEAKGDDPGSPWAIGSRFGGHKAIHAALGTMRDFQSLLKDARNQGIEIALDVAFQCAPDHPYVKRHPEWFKWRPDGTVQFAENPPKKYEDILPFNFESEDWKGLWHELRDVVEFWIEKGVNIFRVDNPHTKSFAFWEWMIADIRSRHPQVIFLAEAFTRPRIMEQLAKAGFNQSYTYFTWRNSAKELREYMNELTRSEMRYYFRPNFWPNTPDILPPELTHGGENAHIRRLILAATLSSSYGLYGPVFEYGFGEPMPGKEEYIDNEKYEIRHWDWTEYTRIREVIATVNRIRKENAALQDTNNIQFAETTNDQVLCYVKKDRRSGNTLIIAVNMDSWHTQGSWVTLPLDQLGLQGGTYSLHDLLSGDRYQWSGAVNYVQLDPNDLPAHILRLEHT